MPRFKHRVLWTESTVNNWVEYPTVEFAYTTHVACDKNNYVLSCDVSVGNVHDSVIFDGLYREVIKKFPEVEMIAVDSAYKTPWIMK